MSKNFDARTWLENEIECLRMAYDESRKDAIWSIHDMLQEDVYDELTNEQIKEILNITTEIRLANLKGR